MKRKKRIAVMAIIAMVLMMLPIQLKAIELDDLDRIYGSGRVETALEVCDAGWSSASTVILAPADQVNLVDALAAAPLAGQENAPILLTFKDHLDPKVKSKIVSLGASKVYAIGAISEGVVAEVDAISGVSVEVLRGTNRWDTVKAINSKLVSPQGTFVVGYNALADALSVSSFAAANGYAIILADVNGNLPLGQYLLGSRFYIIGGSGLVHNISGATRLAGADRFETNREILEKLTFEYYRVYVANGYNEHLVDSLVAAPLAAMDFAPIVLAQEYSVLAADYLRTQVNSSSQIIALGGTGVVSDYVRDSISQRHDSTSSSSFRVTDISPVSLNSFKVVFSQKLDEDTAENPENYVVDGTELDDDDSVILQSDGKSVLVMVDQEDSDDMAPFSQNQKINVEVKNDVIYNEKKDLTAPDYLEEITMYDVTSPKVTYVKAYGNKKLVVEFSEPVSVNNLSSEVRTWKIDNSSLSAMGLNSSATSAVQPTYGTTFPISNKIELYFSSALSSGSHTLKVDDGTSGTSGWMVDGANFVLLESSKDFTVDSVTSAPKVKSVKSINNEIQVEFNRAMYVDPIDPHGGTGSALKTSYYDINDEGADSSLSNSPLASEPEFKTGSGDEIVKFKLDSGVIKKGINIIEIDKYIRDAWGNRLSEDDNIRMSFEYVEDTTIPYVLSVSCVSDTKVRIHFSKIMDKEFAQNRANYTIKDSDGDEVFGKDAGGTARTVPEDEDSDTVELIMPSGEYLRGSDYTIKIKDLRDTAINQNIMDTYTKTFNARDDYGPELEEVIVDPDDHTKAICFFSERLEDSTVVKSNFGYRDGSGTSRDLPSGSTVSLDGTGKIVTVDFPSAYTVKVDNGGAGDSNDKYEVNAIRVANIKDLDGNRIPGIAMTVDVQNQSNISDDYRPHYKTNSFCLYDEGDDVKAEFELSQQLSHLDVNDFSVGADGAGYSNGVTPNSGYTIDDKVILRFSADNKIKAIRALGKDAYLFSKSQNSIVSYSNSSLKILEFPNSGYQVYDDQVKPRLLIGDSTTPTVALTGEGDYAIVMLAFTEPIDSSVVGLYDDDFMFSCGGTNLTVREVAVDSANKQIVKYNVGRIADLPGSTIHVRADSKRIDIRDLKDRGPEDNNKYVPTTDDKNGYSVSDSTIPTITGVVVNSLNNKVTVTFSEAIYTPNSFTDFKIESPYGESKSTTPVAGTIWTWAADNKSVDITFGASDFKANDTYVLVFTSPGSSKYRDLGSHYLATVTKRGFVNDSAADNTAPTVTVPIGDNKNNGETIISGASVYILFSEVLDAASKTAVTDALTAGKAGAGTLSYAWDDNTAKLTVTASGGTVNFASDVTCNISDGTNNNVGVTILAQ